MRQTTGRDLRAHTRQDAARRSQPAGLLVVNCHALVEFGLSMLLQREGFAVVGQAPDVETAVALAPYVDPDLALLDATRSESVSDAVRALRSGVPEAPVVVLVGRSRERLALEALAGGAAACVAGDAPVQEIVRAAHAALAGESFVSARIARSLSRRLGLNGSPPPLTAPRLTIREREVLGLLARGLDNAGIARGLHVSPATVKHHISNILDKLDVENRLQAAVRAVEEDLVEV
jgi:DNA-binding NarL/FixJ family response regulator